MAYVTVIHGEHESDDSCRDLREPSDVGMLDVYMLNSSLEKITT
jgi:hypothetical protein